RIYAHWRFSMIIALASPCIAATLDEGLDKIKRFLADASDQGAEIMCFPEAYLPGLRGQDFAVWPFDQTQQERVLQAVTMQIEVSAQRRRRNAGHGKIDIARSQLGRTRCSLPGAAPHQLAVSCWRI